MISWVCEVGCDRRGDRVRVAVGHGRRDIEGRRLPNPRSRKAISNAIMTDQPGALTFSINGDALAGGLAVSDAATFCECYRAATPEGAETRSCAFARP